MESELVLVSCFELSFKQELIVEDLLLRQGRRIS